MQGLLETIWVRLQSPYVRCISFYDIFVIAVMLIKIYTYSIAAYIHICNIIFSTAVLPYSIAIHQFFKKKSLFKLLSPGSTHPGRSSHHHRKLHSMKLRHRTSQKYLPNVVGCGGDPGYYKYHLWKEPFGDICSVES